MEPTRSSAKNRREKENAEFGELARLLPLPWAITCQLDKASIARLTASYMNLRSVFPFGFVRTPVIQYYPSKIDLKEVSSHLMQTLEGFVFVLSPQGRIMYISETASVHLGMSQVLLTGESMYDYVHQSDHAQLDGVLDSKQSATTNRNADAEFEIERMFFLRMKCVLAKRNAGLTDHGYKLVHCSGYSKMHRSTDGTLDTFGLVAIGCTLPPTAATEIRLHAHSFMFRASLDLKIVFLDSRVVELLAYEPQELLDRSLYDLTHAADSHVIAKAHKILLDKHQVTTQYFRVVAKHGGWVWLQAQLTLVHVPRSSRPSFVVAITHTLSRVEEAHTQLHERQERSTAAVRVGGVGGGGGAAKSATPRLLGAYSEQFYGPNGVRVALRRDDCAAEAAATDDGAARYRLRSLPPIVDACRPPVVVYNDGLSPTPPYFDVSVARRSVPL